MKLRCLAVFAAEPSADRLVAEVVEALKERNPNLRLYGVGGERLQRLGLESLFDTRDFAAVGVKEVLVKLPLILRRLWQTARALRSKQPDLFLSVDMSTCSYWIARALGRRARVKIHYIAPSVWLSRPWRARNFARCYDAILTFYAFEVPYFEGFRARAVHVGHPIFDERAPRGCGSAFRKRHLYGADEPLVGLFFGSRTGELRRLAPLLLESARRLCALQREACKAEPRFVAPSLPSLVPLLKPLLRANDPPVQLVLEAREKEDALCACNTALAAVGTVGAELAVRHVPHALTYRLEPSTFLFAKMFYNLRYWGLVNLLYARPIVPEFIQSAARSDLLARQAQRHLGEEGARLTQQLSQLFPYKKSETRTPARRAAEAIESVCRSATDGRRDGSQRSLQTTRSERHKSRRESCSARRRRR